LASGPMAVWLPFPCQELPFARCWGSAPEDAYSSLKSLDQCGRCRGECISTLDRISSPPPPPPPPCPAPSPPPPPFFLSALSPPYPPFFPPPPLSVAVESLVPTRKCLVLPALRTAANGVSGAQSGRAGSPEVAVAVAIAASLASIRCSLPCCHTAAILSLAERLRRARPQRPQRGRPRDPKRPKRPSHGTIEGKSPGISAANLQARRHWDMYLVLYMPSRSTPPPLLLSILIPPLPCTQWTTRRGHVLAPALGPHPAQAKEGRQAPL